MILQISPIICLAGASKAPVAEAEFFSQTGWGDKPVQDIILFYMIFFRKKRLINKIRLAGIPKL